MEKDEKEFLIEEQLEFTKHVKSKNTFEGNVLIDFSCLNFEYSLNLTSQRTTNNWIQIDFVNHSVELFRHILSKRVSFLSNCARKIGQKKNETQKVERKSKIGALYANLEHYRISEILPFCFTPSS